MATAIPNVGAVTSIMKKMHIHTTTGSLQSLEKNDGMNCMLNLKHQKSIKLLSLKICMKT